MRKITIEIYDDVSDEMALKLVTKAVSRGKIDKDRKGYPKYKNTTLFKNNARVVTENTGFANSEKFTVDSYISQNV